MLIVDNELRLKTRRAPVQALFMHGILRCLHSKELTMKLHLLKSLFVAAGAALTLCAPVTAQAGQVFLTGHDPDFHAQPSLGVGGRLLDVALGFVTGNTHRDGSSAQKFLWVESNIAAPSGHVKGYNSLDDIGVTLLDYDRVDAAGFATVNLANYNAIAIASSFGGTLTRAELDALIARSADIAAFINAGGGLFASAECDNCGADLLGSNPNLYGYLPISVTSIGASLPFTVTAYGASLGLTNVDMNDPTHNSFGLTGGLNVVDTDSAGNATTLAGNVTLGCGGFCAVPEPGSPALAGLALAALALAGRRRRK